MATNDEIIWQYCKSQGLTDAGAAGLMGNLYAESGLRSNNLQNTYEKKLGFTDATYTEAVDNGTYDNFIKDLAGYGLAQWTFWSRKQNLLNYAKEKNKSIGDLQMQLDFLLYEIKTSFKSVYKILTSTDSVREASNIVLLQFEIPADRSTKMQESRAAYGQSYYDKFVQIPTQTITPTVKGNLKYSANNKPLECIMKNSTCYKQTRTMQPIGVLWHSTGANNPTLKRYVQPFETDANYDEMIAILGKNRYGNDWNHIYHEAGIHAWIGKLANGEITTVQTLPWHFRPWGCGSGKNGSCNNGWIQFEICEDGLADPDYFDKVYKEACELTAYLCLLYNIDPMKSVKMNGINIPTILCHADSYRLGVGSNHGDVLHWFPKFGKTMIDVRNDVYALMHQETIIIPPQEDQSIITPTAPVVGDTEEEEEVTQEQFNQMMDQWIITQANKLPSDWSKEHRDWAEQNNLVQGDETGRKMYKKFLTREELVTVLHRIFDNKQL